VKNKRLTYPAGIMLFAFDRNQLIDETWGVCFLSNGKK